MNFKTIIAFLMGAITGGVMLFLVTNNNGVEPTGLSSEPPLLQQSSVASTPVKEKHTRKPRKYEQCAVTDNSITCDGKKVDIEKLLSEGKKKHHDS